MKFNKKRLFLLLLIFIVLAYNLTVFYVDNELKKRDYSSVYNSCHKVWAARGLYNTRSEQNTPQAMMRAFSLGANGAEVDVHYDLKMKKFIVSHNHPTKDKNGELVYTKKNGKLLSLEEFLKAVGKDHYFWLDFKNLGQFDNEQTDQIINRLEHVTRFDNVKERLYIEGSNPLLMTRYTNAGFKTILGIHPLPESSFVSSFVVNVYKLGYFFNNITVIAMPYGKLDDPTFGPDTIKSLEHIPSFIFHVPPDDRLVRDLVNTQNVRVVLVGKDLSINRYSIDTCSSKHQDKK